MAEDNKDKTRQEASDLIKKIEFSILDLQSGLNQLMREYKLGNPQAFSSSIQNSLGILTNYTRDCSTELNEKYPRAITSKDSLPAPEKPAQ